MRWRTPTRPRIGPTTDVYLLDVTEQWYDGQHSYWAFTDPSWYEWATSDDPVPPRWLRRTNDKLGEHLPERPTRNDKVLYLYHGAVMILGGHFVGAERTELDAWLGSRVPVGVLEVVEETQPLGENDGE